MLGAYVIISNSHRKSLRDLAATYDGEWPLLLLATPGNIAYMCSAAQEADLTCALSEVG